MCSRTEIVLNAPTNRWNGLITSSGITCIYLAHLGLLHVILINACVVNHFTCVLCTVAFELTRVGAHNPIVLVDMSSSFRKAPLALIPSFRSLAASYRRISAHHIILCGCRRSPAHRWTARHPRAAHPREQTIRYTRGLVVSFAFGAIEGEDRHLF